MKAIETKYKGYRFRSRLEARWAVFFDTIGIEWEYEKEGFVLPSGKMYLPDFYLPKVSLRGEETGVYVEIKPDVLSIMNLELGDFSYPLCAFAGMPPGEAGEYASQASGFQISQGWDSSMVFMICTSCGHVKIEYGDEGSYRHCPRCRGDVMASPDGVFLVGQDAAKSARFEHGEAG